MTDNTEPLTSDQWRNVANDWKALYKATMAALQEAIAMHDRIHDKYRAAQSQAATYRQQLDELTSGPNA